MLSVGIVGAGTAGLASALFLARAGHTVTLFERAPVPGPVGAGLLLQPPGQAVLARLGLAQTIRARSAMINQLYGTGHQGHVALDLRYGAQCGWGVHRGQLFDALFSAVQAENAHGKGILVLCGTQVVALRAAAAQVSLESESGAQFGGFDLVVLADGTHSHLRAQARVPVQVQPYPWGAFWAILPQPAQAPGTVLRQWYRQANQMLGLMPSGFAPSGEVAGQAVTSLFWSEQTANFTKFREAGLGAWKDAVRKLTREADGYLDQLTHPAQLTPASYADVRMPRWHSRESPVVVLGDAAHGMSPQLGQGATMALIDALTLAHCVAARVRAPRDVPNALDYYSSLRKPHLGFYQVASRWMTPLYQSDRVAPAWLRDRLMQPLGRLPGVHTMMLRTLSGVQTWRGSVQLPT
jgi:2-polyprenyl-6-methoxyphenol hydroxylase-like FAD-dependent oxidoreductase